MVCPVCVTTAVVANGPAILASTVTAGVALKAALDRNGAVRPTGVTSKPASKPPVLENKVMPKNRASK